jgi:hypothetical protein
VLAACRTPAALAGIASGLTSIYGCQWDLPLHAQLTTISKAQFTNAVFFVMSTCITASGKVPAVCSLRLGPGGPGITPSAQGCLRASLRANLPSCWLTVGGCRGRRASTLLRRRQQTTLFSWRSGLHSASSSSRSSSCWSGRQ